MTQRNLFTPPDPPQPAAVCGNCEEEAPAAYLVTITTADGKTSDRLALCRKCAGLAWSIGLHGKIETD